MNFHIAIFTFLILLLLIFFGFQSWLHQRYLRSFRYRIHVNGTRGKSSITRLIRAGLSAGGYNCFAKTTGTLARKIYPDGSESAVPRWGKPSILEQLRIVKEAYQEKAQVLIVECMAIEPRYQFASETQMIKSNIGIITNVRADHLEVMGPTLQDVKKAFASAIPLKGRCYLLEKDFDPIFEKASLDRDTKLIPITEKEISKTKDQDIKLFPYWEHKENLALALKVCEDLGVPKETALSGMVQMSPDPGVLQLIPLQFFGKKISFLNAMAANDPDSLRDIWSDARKRFPKIQSFSLLFHCREDRIERSLQLAKEIVSWKDLNCIFLTGTGTIYAESEIKKRSPHGTKLLNLEGSSPETILESLVFHSISSSLVMGLGNIGGIGLELLQLIRNRSEKT